jgi:hypothetical protein
VLVGCHPCDRHEHVVVLMECLPSSPALTLLCTVNNYLVIHICDIMWSF